MIRLDGLRALWQRSLYHTFQLFTFYSIKGIFKVDSFVCCTYNYTICHYFSPS